MLGVNPWLLTGAALTILVSFFGGLNAGMKIEKASWLEMEQKYQSELQLENQKANQIALVFGESLQTSQDKVIQLQRKLNEQKSKLASCDSNGGIKLTPTFTGLYNEALQSNAGDPSQSADTPTGTDLVRVSEVHIENGKRWKDCRNQLNSLIDILNK